MVKKKVINMIVTPRSGLLVMFLVLTACGTSPPRPAPQRRQGDVSANALPAAASERYENAPDVRYVQPQSNADNPLPNYPKTLLVNRLPPTMASVRLIVDTAGRVVEVQNLTKDDSAVNTTFYLAVRDACERWRFSPLVEVSTSLVSHEQADGSINFDYPKIEKSLPFHLDYAFRFSQRDGKPSVGAEKSTTSSNSRR